MARYAGEIKISSKSGYFVNFYPGYKVVNEKFTYLDEDDLEYLLPDSEYLNINLVSTSGSFNIRDFFLDGEDVLLDFTSSDLQSNTKSDGTIYPTAWKLDVSRLQPSAIHHMEDFGWYYLPENEELDENWKQMKTKEVTNQNIIEGMQILLRVPDQENTLIGPFKVFYNEVKDAFFVRLETDPKRSLIQGFYFPDGLKAHTETLEQQDVTRNYVRIDGRGVQKVYFDPIDDETLLENFSEILRRRPNSRMLAPNADQENYMIDIYSNSLINSQSIPKHIAKMRRERLEAMFAVERGFEESIDSIARIAGSLFELADQNSQTGLLLEKLAGSDDFLEKIHTFRPMVERKKNLDLSIDTLTKEKKELESALEELRRLAPKEQLEAYRLELERLQQQKEQADEQVRQSLARAHISQTLEDLESRAQYLASEIARKENEIRMLDAGIEQVQERMDGMLEEAGRKALELSFDNMISSRFAEQSAKIVRKEELERYQNAARAIAHLEKSYLDPASLTEYLVSAMRELRPDFSRNDVLNLMICLSQGFLTILTGAPGTGKTSLCKKSARVLGLYQPGALSLEHPEYPSCSRFVSVSVERGWTSRRDLIGFYNSLTQNFDKASVPVYDLLSILDQESRSTLCASDLPALILLDDANLSSMEYYWADFMSMSDEESVRGILELGENYNLQIPRNLRFLATIQSDHTTEPLSLRLLDRAWVISLPKGSLAFSSVPSLVAPGSKLISESLLQQTFSPQSGTLYLPSELEKELTDILDLFEKAGIELSTRSEIAVRRYIQSALCWFEAEGEEGSRKDPGTIALDYAIAQRFLPVINGSGERFRSWLDRLENRLRLSGLERSAKIVQNIMEKGDNSMQFYQFFS